MIDRYQTGAPARQFYDKSGTPVTPEHAIRIASGQWAAIEYNGRYTSFSTGNWWYEQVTVNVSWAEEFSSNLFMSQPPLEHDQQLTRLL